MSSSERFSGLRTKSLLITCLLALSISAYLFFFTLPKQQQWITARFSEAAERALDQLSTSIVSPLLTQEYAELYASLDAQLAQRPEWKHLAVTDSDERQLYPLQAVNLAKDSGDVEFIRAINVEGQLLARLRLTANFNAAINEGNQLQIQLAALQLFTLGVAFLFVIWLIDRHITAPLKKLIGAFRGLGKGKFDVSLGPSRSGEIGRVLTEFENMRISIEETQRRLQQLRQEAEFANRAKSDFVSHVSHELRTPLHAILGLAELSRVDQTISAKQRDYAEKIYVAGTHLRTLVDDILDLGAIESDRIRLELEPVAVVALIEECVALTAVTAKAANVDVRFCTQSLEQLRVEGDFKRLKQVFLNLLSNAIKYNKVGGNVEVSGTPLGRDKVRITVKDNGVGLSKKQLSKLFTPFDRLGAELRDKQGTGIGLVITKNLIDLMSGEISVQSTQHVGTTFTVTLPSAAKELSQVQLPSDTSATFDQSKDVANLAAEDEQRIASHSNTNSHNARALKILVAEDSATNRQIIDYQLQALGYQAKFANDGILALEASSQCDFDVLLTDVKMPRMDGPDLTKAIRERESQSDYSRKPLYIAAVTANAMPEDKRAYAACGMDDFIAKPVKLATLKALLDKVPG